MHIVVKLRPTVHLRAGSVKGSNIHTKYGLLHGQLLLAIAEVAISLNRFGPICRQEGEEDTPLSMQDIRVCSIPL